MVSYTSRSRIACFCKEPLFADLIHKVILSECDIDFISVNTVALALEKLKQENFDLIVSGHLFADGDSQKILTWLAEHPNKNQVPFILFTSCERPNFLVNFQFQYIEKSKLDFFQQEVIRLLARAKESSSG